MVNYILKAERVKRNLKQTDMCQLLNLKSVSAYSQKENGKRSFKQEDIRKISIAFNLKGDEIRKIFFDNQLNLNDKSSIINKSKWSD